MEYVKDSVRYSGETLGHGWRLFTSLYSTAPDKVPLVKVPLAPPTPIVANGWLISVLGNVSPWVRLAGLSGALAVGLGAYGAHGMKKTTDDRRNVFETANKYHFIHTLALLAVPLTHRPNLVGTLLVVGTAGFSGTCYFHAMTGDSEIIKYTPYGGMTLIAAWLAMIL
ncbi:Transmembrane protein [Halotydeus destructor]|nr:Transmembrane protein [Halotydeus destructor]